MGGGGRLIRALVQRRGRLPWHPRGRDVPGAHGLIALLVGAQRGAEPAHRREASATRRAGNPNVVDLPELGGRPSACRSLALGTGKRKRLSGLLLPPALEEAVAATLCAAARPAVAPPADPAERCTPGRGHDAECVREPYGAAQRIRRARSRRLGDCVGSRPGDRRRI